MSAVSTEEIIDMDDHLEGFCSDDAVRVQRVSRNFERQKSGIRQFEMKINTDTLSSVCGFNKIETTPDVIGKKPALPFVSNTQLNRFNPGSIVSNDSKIFETSEDLREFVKNVQLFQILDFIQENVASVREKKLQNFCAKIAAMKKLTLLSIQVPIKENELEKLASSVTSQSDLFIFDILQQKPLLSKSVLAAILNVSPKNTRINVKIEKEERSWPVKMLYKYFESRINKKDVEGVLWFLKNEENSEWGKIIFIRNCAKPITEQILKHVQKMYPGSKPTFIPTAVEIRVGNRSLYMCYE
ncbi:unnamed protein product [Caenorhabditis angaria]|uniref:Uncharacterized protein n=1 Tax=Caenorhabditis angaria TaxID=860376 RepID=A0A9P1N7D0_9PELO|nr:unnamed protein product [Caenorhabditis angaria]